MSEYIPYARNCAQLRVALRRGSKGDAKIQRESYESSDRVARKYVIDALTIWVERLSKVSCFWSELSERL